MKNGDSLTHFPVHIFCLLKEMLYFCGGLLSPQFFEDMATRRLTIALLSIFLSVVAVAANKDLEKDITMVSYEQSWRDSHGTLALKNNTSEEIQNVVFLI